MFNQLPQNLQQEILSYLEANDFKTAKKLKDAFFEHHQPIDI